MWCDRPAHKSSLARCHGAHVEPRSGGAAGAAGADAAVARGGIAEEGNGGDVGTGPGRAGLLASPRSPDGVPRIGMRLQGDGIARGMDQGGVTFGRWYYVCWSQ